MTPRQLDLLVQERQARLRGTAIRTAPRPGLRARLGRAIIAVGTMVGGERLEHPARPPASMRSARSTRRGSAQATNA